MSLPLLLLAASGSVMVYGGPKPEPTATYKDWVTGCDNLRNCSAVALEPVASAESQRNGRLEILIEQPAAHQLDPVVTIRVPADAAEPESLTLHIGDTSIALPPAADGRFVFRGPAARALVLKLRSGTWAVMRDGGEQDIASASLAGLTAALLRIDDQQGKVGTPHALSRPGKRLPHGDLHGYGVSLSRPARSERPPTAPDAKAMAELRASDRCGADSARSAPPRMVRLDSDSTMMIMPWQCGNGAYNLYSNIMIVNGFGEIRPAVFDYDNGITGDGPSNVLVNVSWDAKKRVLEGFARHRGFGDCGRVDRYIWDGEKFMLSEQLLMPECRMAFDRIRTWTVDVADR